MKKIILVIALILSIFVPVFGQQITLERAALKYDLNFDTPLKPIKTDIEENFYIISEEKGIALFFNSEKRQIEIRVNENIDKKYLSTILEFLSSPHCILPEDYNMDIFDIAF